jgi:hypothetical protein
VIERSRMDHGSRRPTDGTARRTRRRS